ncbi:hypothetical protein J5N97_008262 [Dioscorea zingiberensis]|uniref:WRKY domain-containing protein n=1 Tax=Dioscorea zingiberensis TaxID=325984 RepID=A0A9D5DDK4_9LILI|nr:hypothetical protein J5N97_008262 [Dioscorea zingiberensis]
MENNQGDLADIVRASSRAGGPTNIDLSAADNWQSVSSEPVSFSPASDGQREDFIDPFSNLRDPPLNELSVSSFLEAHDSSAGLIIKMADEVGDNDGGTAALFAQKMLSDEIIRPSNVYSKMFQISPGASKDPSPVIGGSPVDHIGLQISSSRSPMIKRRKSQAKKVVCIPAPAAANSRQSGEIVPSDLWAWRKYGQKPIKGSPYPRGYYRCSSSKGCPARKQVERSRTDPNMLVITYTSEHNHPWPTQRNALAGSTRSQPSSKNSSSGPKNSPNNLQKPQTTSSSSSTTPPLITDEVFNESYKPMIQESDHQQTADDFFADLAELESDPMSLIFSKDQLIEEEDQEDKEAIMGSVPFSILDNWGGEHSFGEAKRGL